MILLLLYKNNFIAAGFVLKKKNYWFKYKPEPDQQSHQINSRTWSTVARTWSTASPDQQPHQINSRTRSTVAPDQQSHAPDQQSHAPDQQPHQINSRTRSTVRTWSTALPDQQPHQINSRTWSTASPDQQSTSDRQSHQINSRIRSTAAPDQQPHQINAPDQQSHGNAKGTCWMKQNKKVSTEVAEEGSPKTVVPDPLHRQTVTDSQSPQTATPTYENKFLNFCWTTE